MIRPSPAPTNFLTTSESRRIALAAQGFSARRSVALSPWTRAAATIDRIGLLQLDSVSVLVRAHYFPVYSRIGAYDRTALDRRAFAPDHRQFFEYWAHEASLLPLHLHPLLRWRMARAESLVGIYGGLAKFALEERAYVRGIYESVAKRGPLSAGILSGSEKRTGSWWGWNKAKAALEYLFWTGAVTVASRRSFERVYDLTERVLPTEILSYPTPDPSDAIRALAGLAGRALGIATEADIRDYFRLPLAETRRAIAELVEDGVLACVDVEGWRQQAYLAAGAHCPRRVGATTLVSPFDPLIWHRPRSERLFDLHYRIEIYVPAAKRRHGYYVLPFLQDGRFHARVDLKADRPASVLSVRASHLEGGSSPDTTAASLARELERLAAWLDLKSIEIVQRGDLAADLAKHF